MSNPYDWTVADIDFLARHAATSPAKVALISGERVEDFETLNGRANRAANVFHKLGCVTHDRVAVMSFNSIEGFEKGGRPELAAKELKEIAFLTEYLPKPLAEDELEQLVKAAVAEVGATSKAQMGAVMKVATEKAAGRVDGRTLSQAVQKVLP